MKARALALALALVASAGCNTPTSTTQGDLNGPQALVVSNSELFIANTNTDELRVLELQAEVTARDFVRAPNPLFVLSIPVVTRPVALAADTDGTNQGKFILALSAVAGRLGVVDREKKVEVQEVALPGTPLSLAARTLPDGGALVLIGISTGSQGSVVSVRLPPVAQLPQPGLAVNTFAELGEAAPAALAISPDGNTVTVGDRLADETNSDLSLRRGGLIFLDATSQLGLDAPKAQSQRRVMVGGPVGAVVYSPAANSNGTTLPAGKYLYLTVESAGCALATRCGGIQQLVDGQVPETAPGILQSPVQIPGIPTGLAVAPNATLNLPASAGLGGRAVIPLLVAVPSTDGRVYFMDGVGARIFDVNSSPPAAGSVGHFDGNGSPIGSVTGGADLTGPSNIQLSEGAIDTQTIVVTYEGHLPALIDRAYTLTGAVLSDPGVDFGAAGVEVNDRVSFTACPDYDGTVAAIGPTTDGSLTSGQLRLDPAPPANCSPGGSYSIRVANGQYTVVGSLDGLLGRAQPNTLFQGPARYFYRPPGFDPTKPGLSFVMGTGQVSGSPDEVWVFTVNSGISPFFTPGGSHAIMPGPIDWSPGLSKFYVGYPGSTYGSQVSEIDPSLVDGTNTPIGERN